MGWEWHNRKRDAHGRWANLGKCEQIHIRCTVREWEMIRQDALKAKLTMSEYLLTLAAREGVRRSRRAYTEP